MTNAPPTDLMSPLTLFMSADLVVKLVMVGLLAASVWTWAIIFTHSLRLRRINRQTEAYERDFWASSDIDGFHSRRGDEKLPTAAVLTAGLDEWRRSTRGAVVDRAGTRERLASRMNAAVAVELDRLADRLNILATVGSVAPFVGLFGTVWGIMRSFTAIAGANNTSPRGRRARHRRGVVRHRHRPVRGDPRGDRLQSPDPRPRPARGAARPLRRSLPRDAQPRARKRGRGRPLMGASLPSSSRRGGRSRRAPMAEINVTPLVDVMLVLLIIFMVTAPLLVAGVPIDLPESRAGALDQQAEPVQVVDRRHRQDHHR